MDKIKKEVPPYIEDNRKEKQIKKERYIALRTFEHEVEKMMYYMTENQMIKFIQEIYSSDNEYNLEEAMEFMKCGWVMESLVNQVQYMYNKDLKSFSDYRYCNGGVSEQISWDVANGYFKKVRIL